MLTATSLSSGQIGLALLPLAALAFASAYWQPGRRRVSYNVALQALGLVIALIAGGLALNESGTRLAGALALTLIFGGQAVLRRNSLWAALSLGLGLLTIAFALDQFVAGARLLRAAALAALIMSAAYTICGERLRTTPLRYWTWPAITWGSLSGLIAAALGFVLFFFDPPFATLAILGLAGLAALHTWLWRQATLGYVAAPLMLGSALIAASQGFFTGWQPAPGDMALIICALVLGLALIGQALRRVDRAYALPYEVTAFAVLLLAPWAAAGDPVRLTLTWAAMATLYSLALWRYRRPWMLALAFGAGDLSILEGIAWLLPERAPEQDGLLLTGIVWAQALTSAWLRRRTALWRTAGTWGYVAAGLGGAGALALAAGSDTFQTLVDLALAAASNATLATVALALAALLVVLTQIERNTVAAWGSLALAIPGAWLAHTAAGLDGAWAAAWMVLELVGVCLAGWGAQRLSATLWRQVTGLGAVSAALLLAIATFGGGFAPLTFALANLGLLLATLAVRERAFGYAYGSGAAFVGAILSQMTTWESARSPVVRHSSRVVPVRAGSRVAPLPGTASRFTTYRDRRSGVDAWHNCGSGADARKRAGVCVAALRRVVDHCRIWGIGAASSAVRWRHRLLYWSCSVDDHQCSANAKSVGLAWRYRAAHGAGVCYPGALSGASDPDRKGVDEPGARVAVI
ncbi:MAG: hypothetical protein RMJ48_17825 [Roseiflexaceae bacterium]|nr:hypothetical protein [Roseiflexaceae bacterium]